MQFRTNRPGFVPALFRVDHPAAKLGVGVSRSDDPKAGLYRLKIHFREENQPVIETLRAASAKQARKFALNKYNGRCTRVEILSNRALSYGK